MGEEDMNCDDMKDWKQMIGDKTWRNNVFNLNGHAKVDALKFTCGSKCAGN
jgi:hypothetical protein